MQRTSPSSKVCGRISDGATLTGARMNLATNLEASAFFFPGNPAVREAGRETTYAQLNERANRIATGLMRMGVRPGEHVGLCALNSADWIAFYFGVIKAGAVAVTLAGSPHQERAGDPRQPFETSFHIHIGKEAGGNGTGEGFGRVGEDHLPRRRPGPGPAHGHGLRFVQGARPGSLRHGGDPLHRGDHRHTQRGDADPRRHPFFGLQRRLLRTLHRVTTSPSASCPSTTCSGRCTS